MKYAAIPGRIFALALLLATALPVKTSEPRLIAFTENYVTTETVTVHARPDRNSRVLNNLPANTRLRSLARTRDGRWLQVDARPTLSGSGPYYVESRGLRLDDTATAGPVVGPDAPSDEPHHDPLDLDRLVISGQLAAAHQENARQREEAEARRRAEDAARARQQAMEEERRRAEADAQERERRWREEQAYQRSQEESRRRQQAWSDFNNRIHDNLADLNRTVQRSQYEIAQHQETQRRQQEQERQRREWERHQREREAQRQQPVFTPAPAPAQPRPPASGSPIAGATPPSSQTPNSCWYTPDPSQTSCVDTGTRWDDGQLIITVRNICKRRIYVSACGARTSHSDFCAASGIQSGGQWRHTVYSNMNPTGNYTVQWVGSERSIEDWTCASGGRWRN